MTYKEKLTDPRWQKKRLEILERDNFTCQLCKSQKKTLTIHHFSYSKNPWDVQNQSLLTLCFDCHKKVQIGQEAIIISIKELISRNYNPESLGCIFNILDILYNTDLKDMHKIIKSIHDLSSKEYDRAWDIMEGGYETNG